MLRSATLMDKESKKTAIQMAYASSVGIAMVIMIFGGLYLGIYLDRKFGTGYKFTFILLLVGIVAGFRNLYVLIKKISRNEKPVIKYLKSEPHRKRPPAKKA
jgi:ATP synthase protein I